MKTILCRNNGCFIRLLCRAITPRIQALSPPIYLRSLPCPCPFVIVPIFPSFLVLSLSPSLVCVSDRKFRSPRLTETPWLLCPQIGEINQPNNNRALAWRVGQAFSLVASLLFCSLHEFSEFSCVWWRDVANCLWLVAWMTWVKSVPCDWLRWKVCAMACWWRAAGWSVCLGSLAF